jgi:hypothetical protein
MVSRRESCRTHGLAGIPSVSYQEEDEDPFRKKIPLSASYMYAAAKSQLIGVVIVF